MPSSVTEASSTDRQPALTWAQRLKRVFAIEIETCQRCGGQLRVIASIEAPPVIARILEHLGRDADTSPARSSTIWLNLRSAPGNCQTLTSTRLR